MISQISSKSDYEKPVKVLITAIYGNPYNGVINYIYNLVTAINMEKLHIDLYLMHSPINNDSVMKKLDELGVNVFIGASKYSRFHYIQVARDLRRLIRLYHYDVLHCNTGAALYQAVNASVGKRCGIKAFIAHSHNSVNQTERRHIVKAIVGSVSRRLILKKADLLLACSQIAGNWLFGKRMMEERGVVIKNGINTRKFAYNSGNRNKIRAGLGIPENTFALGLTANFTVQKNHAFLIQVFSEVCKLHDNATLLLLGDGAEREKIVDLAKELCVYKKIHFVGSVANAHEYYSAMDVFVMPSLFEGLPYSGIEAQAACLPCLFSDTISAELALTEYAHFYSLENTPLCWAKEILKLADGFPDLVREKQKEATVLKIRNAGYDLKETANFITSIYLSSLTEVQK